MDNINRPETEQDGERAAALRLLKVRHQSQVFRDQTRALSQSQNSTPEATSELTSRNDLAAHHVCELPGQLNES